MCIGLQKLKSLYYENFDLHNVVTPINANRLRNLLVESGYDEAKTRFLFNGFTQGFDLGYEGPVYRQDTSNNIPLFDGIGNAVELWNKVMKEVEMKRYAGPYSSIPFKNYIQSPIGLVPKAGGQTRLIFHLSYNFAENKSYNSHTPPERCKVKYNDLDHAVRNCLRIMDHYGSNQTIWMSIADLKSAFRVVPGRPDQWKFLLMMARHPKTGVMYFFADKCMPFGASISYNLYSQFSEALAHLLSFYTNTSFKITNYLDDFLFVGASKGACNYLVRSFIDLCQYLGVPIAEDKVVQATTKIKFLGVLMNGCGKYLQVPEDKKNKALQILLRLREKRTATVKEIQEITGLLNFLAKVIVPGRTFTRRMYAKITSKTKNLRQHHHVTLDSEFKSDCKIWTEFLMQADEQPEMLCRPFVDLSLELQAEEIDLYTDSSANLDLGFGGIFMNRWFFGKWGRSFMKKFNPSIQYLELYAVCMAVFIWIDYFRNYRLVLHCDNKSVVGMINITSSGCPHCMVLIRKLMVKCLQYNTRVFAKHVKGSENGLSDSLSRFQFDRFLKLAKDAKKQMQTMPDVLSNELYPVEKIW